MHTFIEICLAVIVGSIALVAGSLSLVLVSCVVASLWECWRGK